MRYLLPCFTLSLTLAVGCTPDSRNSDADDEKDDEARISASDDITWIEKRIKHEDVSIDLGYRDGYAGGRWVQPVTVIRRKARPVANAMVFNRLMSIDENEATGEESATTYQPSSDNGDAEYLGSKLRLAEGASQSVVNFRVVLPSQQEPWTRDVTIEVK